MSNGEFAIKAILIAAAALVAISGESGWGWFLFVAVII